MTRAPRSAFLSTPLAAISIAMLTALGCGSGGGAGPATDAGPDTKLDGNAGSTGTAGHAGTTGTGGGGSGGNTAGTTGTGGGGSGGNTAGTTGTGGGGSGGNAAGTTGTGGGGAGGNIAGNGGRGGSGGSTAGTTGTGGGGSGGNTAGSTGTAGSTAGTTGTAGNTAGTTGTGGGGAGGTGPACVDGTACMPSAGVHGVCTGGACVGCASDGACSATTAYGAGYICLVGSGDCVQGTCHNNGDCNGKICDATHSCASCSGNSSCVTAYGTGYVCQGSTGKCVQGACATNAECAGTGQICNASNQCVSCGTSDTACTAAYASGYICVGGDCVQGTCHNGGECMSSQQICSATSHTCVDCTDDNSCQTSYNAADYLCITGSPNKCVQGTCRVNNDCSNGQICINNTCIHCTDNASCGSGKVCLTSGCTPGNCIAASDCTTAGDVCTANNCSPCASDGECLATGTGYGANYLCVGTPGTCVPGNCRAKGDCTSTNQICNTTSMFCQACGADGDCTSEYGANHICVSGVCTAGNCKTTTGGADPCSGGQICGVTTPFLCGACSTDVQCQDAAAYGPGYYCQSGVCTAGQCRKSSDCSGASALELCNASLACNPCTTNAQCVGDPSYGANHVCVAGQCISGSCATSADCTGTNQLCDGMTHTCKACTDDTSCMNDTTYGAAHICLKDSNGQNGQCLAGDCHNVSSDCTTAGQVCNSTSHTCVGCAGSDATCTGDARYGTGTICVSNLCVTGDCHDTSADCTAGKICGVSTTHTCGTCSTDTQCTSDTVYGSADICFQGACKTGNCHTSSTDCSGANAGLICGAVTPNVCGSCTTDSQCKADPAYGASTICDTATGPNSGKCVTAACSPNSTTCSANTADFCCGALCVTGNCCSNTDCVNNPSFGAGYACTGNVCTHCDAISGNTYYVDPLNGNDAGATGSNLAGGTPTPSCAFKTITRAMQVIGAFAAPNTKVIIVGTGATTGLAASEALPITVQPNVIISTQGGAIKITLPNATNQANPGNNSGFVFSNSGSGIQGNPAAPLTLDGNGNLSGRAIAVQPGAGNSVSLSNLTIQNTRDHAIVVTNGVLNIGAGVVVKNAGLVNGALNIQRDGLLVNGTIAGGVVTAAGVANINVPSGQTTTQFTSNTLNGIEVTTGGSVTITGSATTPPNGNGTVLTNLNGAAGVNNTAGIRINQTPGTTGLATNTITGLVSWGNTVNGADIYGGSHVSVRSSVFGANTQFGVDVRNGAGAAGLDVTNIDLGTAANFGANWMQTPTTVLGRNGTAGLCVAMGNTVTGGPLKAAGEELISGAIGTAGTQVNCAAAAGGTVTKAANFGTNGNSCTGGAAIGKTAGSVVTFTLTNCN